MAVRPPVGVLFAQTLDDLGGNIGELLQIGGLPAAALVAYRLTSKAHGDAVEVARETTSDVREQLEAERANWRLEKASYAARIKTLEDALATKTLPVSGLWPQPPEE